MMIKIYQIIRREAEVIPDSVVHVAKRVDNGFPDFQSAWSDVQTCRPEAWATIRQFEI